jgi:outer membrane protein assembly factor BamB
MRGQARAAGVLALLAALASCAVDVEGAPCTSVANCPSDQGCGADARCSARALACAACRPGDTRCGAQGLEACDAAADGVCSAWAVRRCGDSQACQAGAAGAACVCVGEPEVCRVAGDVCDGSAQVATCQADAWGCLSKVAKTPCKEHQACGGDAPAASCACLPAPACLQPGPSCAGSTAVNCVASNGCLFLFSSAVCGDHQACGIASGSASCTCVPSACQAQGAQCSADRSRVLACARDVDQCLFESQAAIPCGPGEVCGDALACAPTYAVALTAPAPAALVGSAGVTVTATVTLATAAAAFAPLPAALALLADGVDTGTALARGAQNGLVVTYAGTWVPPAGMDAAVHLVARPVEGAPGSFDSPSVPVQVDTVPPTVTGASAACSTSPCVRDGVLTLTANVADARLQSVTALLDVDQLRPVPLLDAGGGVFQAQVALKDWRFPAFRRDVVATIVSRDGASNSVSTSLAPVTVTRLRWATPLPSSPHLTGPAVDSNGDVVVAGDNGTLHHLAPTTGTATSVSLATVINAGAGPTQPPVLGSAATWIATDDGVLFSVAADGTPSAKTCPAGPNSQKLYRPVLDAHTKDEVHAFNQRGRLWVVPPDGTCPIPISFDPVTAAPAGALDALFAPSLATRATLNRYLIDPIDGSPALNPSPPPALQDAAAIPNPCTGIVTSPVLDGHGRVFVGCSNGQLHLVDFAVPSATWLGTLSSPVQAAVVLPGDDVVIGAEDQVLRLTPSRAPPTWSTDLGRNVTGLAVVYPDGSGVALLATTGGGTLHALTIAGEVVWAATGGDLGTAALQFPAVAPIPPGAPTTALPTLYATSAAGVVYAVVVDTALDRSSPWPKAHHDLRNTGDAASSLP